MAINSRRKGAAGERELAAILREYGYTDARRGQQHKGGQDSPDVVDALPGIHIECKRHERLNIDEAMSQAARDCGASIPAVFHRKNRTEWKVTCYLKDFIALYERGKNDKNRNA